MKLKQYLSEIKWEDITKNIKPEDPIIYKNVRITKEPKAKNFPIQQIKKVLDNVPIGQAKEIRVLNTPWVKGNEYGMWISKQNLVLIGQKGATKKTINYALAHELGHANGFHSEKEAHTFALNHGYQRKFNI